MQIFRGAIAACAALAAAGAAAAPSIDKLAAAFGTRAAAHGLALSPLGTRVLYIAPAGTGGAAVIVAEVATGRTNVVFGNTGNGVRPRSCHWKSEVRLICLMYGVESTGLGTLSFTRVVAIDADGKNIKQLGQRDSTEAVGLNQYSGNVIDWLPTIPTTSSCRSTSSKPRLGRVRALPISESRCPV